MIPEEKIEEAQNDEEVKRADPTGETEARHQAELAAERDEHNRKTGGGAYPLSTEK